MTPCYGMKGAVPVLSLQEFGLETGGGLYAERGGRTAVPTETQKHRRAYINIHTHTHTHTYTNYGCLKNTTLQLRTLAVMCSIGGRIDFIAGCIYFTDEHFTNHTLCFRNIKNVRTAYLQDEIHLAQS